MKRTIKKLPDGTPTSSTFKCPRCGAQVLLIARVVYTPDPTGVSLSSIRVDSRICCTHLDDGSVFGL